MVICTKRPPSSPQADMDSQTRSEQNRVNVQQILKSSLNIDVDLVDIEPIPRGYNNYLFTVQLGSTVDSSVEPAISKQAGTVTFKPTSVNEAPRRLVVRLLKTELGGLPERVQNEVAALALVREPLRSVVRVPDVYAWSEGRGINEIPFIVMEHLPGIPLDTIWSQLDLPSRLPIICQISDILTSLQSVRIPVPYLSSNHAFGGLAFSPSGEITTAMHPEGIGGPFTSAEAQWLSMLSVRIRDADANPVIKGWKGLEQPDLRSRLDSFLQSDEGFMAIMPNVATEPTFVHGDFKGQNMLICPETYHITGLLDFEFSRIGTFPEELMDGLNEFRNHSCVQPAPGADLYLLECNGWPCQESDNPAGLGCQTAKAWKNLFRVPTHGYEATAKTYSFLDKICPWYFCQEPWRNAHDMVVERRIAETALNDALTAWGI
ncbi:kinase-like domain-containing protein [Mycena pura]|uniref:Kinase-like domain-containing protein n=1 Tax=Mycena pura TaxID=153505 RepID=A0AAD6VVM3_9AGAR|nr:kinase-like domain-containing protein [Mycena pura]